MNETSPITELKGIGEKTGKLFERVGVTKIGQLLSYFPRAYEKYDEIKRADALKDGTVAAVYGCFPAALAVKRIKNKQIVTGIFESNFQKIKVLWYNMPYLRSTLKAGTFWVLRGKVSIKNKQLVLEQPTVFSMEAYQKILECLHPVYPLTEGLSAKTVEKAVRQVLDQLPPAREMLPEKIRKTYQLAEYHFALEQIHFPQTQEQMLLARHRLVFDEFYLFILALRRLINMTEKQTQDFHIKKIQLFFYIVYKKLRLFLYIFKLLDFF